MDDEAINFFDRFFFDYDQAWFIVFSSFADPADPKGGCVCFSVPFCQRPPPQVAAGLLCPSPDDPAAVFRGEGHPWAGEGQAPAKRHMLPAEYQDSVSWGWFSHSDFWERQKMSAQREEFVI